MGWRRCGRQGQPGRARELYERALALRQRTLGVAHPDVAWTLTNVARVMGTSGEVRLALRRVHRPLRFTARLERGMNRTTWPGQSRFAARSKHGSGTFGRTIEFRRSALAAGADLRPVHPLVAQTRADLGADRLCAGRERTDAPSAALDAERWTRPFALHDPLPAGTTGHELRGEATSRARPRTLGRGRWTRFGRRTPSTRSLGRAE